MEIKKVTYDQIKTSYKLLPEMEELVTEKEASKILGLSWTTLRDKRLAGDKSLSGLFIEAVNGQKKHKIFYLKNKLSNTRTPI